MQDLAGTPGQKGAGGATSVVARTATTPVPHDTTGGTVAVCAQGTQAIAGGERGVDVVNDTYPAVPRQIGPATSEFPATDGAVPNGWDGTATNTTPSTDETLTAYVACASP